MAMVSSNTPVCFSSPSSAAEETEEDATVIEVLRDETVDVLRDETVDVLRDETVDVLRDEMVDVINKG